MIQRIQTVYLFLASVLALAFTFFNDYLIELVNADLVLITSAVVAFVSILLFKNRALQTKLVYFSIFLALIGLVLYAFEDGLNSFFLDWQFYFIPLSIFALLLANKGIKKDEEIIRSSNRLR